MRAGLANQNRFFPQPGCLGLDWARKVSQNLGLQTGDNGDIVDNERPWESRSFTLRAGVIRFSGPECRLPRITIRESRRLQVVATKHRRPRREQWRRPVVVAPRDSDEPDHLLMNHKSGRAAVFPCLSPLSPVLIAFSRARGKDALATRKMQSFECSWASPAARATGGTMPTRAHARKGSLPQVDLSGPWQEGAAAWELRPRRGGAGRR